jgi:hypothetical protein
MPPVPWSTKIGVSHNRGDKTDFQKLSSVAPPILGRWPVYRVRLHQGHVLGFSHDL